MSNNYAGFQIPSKEYKIERIVYNRSDTSEFMEYVKGRKPVILTSFHSLFDGWNDINVLKERAGESTVQVESKIKNQFGLGLKTKMTFNEFCSIVEHGDHYLNTQYDEADSNLSSLLSPPLSSLVKDIDLDIPIFHDMRLQLMNYWIGGGEEETSSNLHHDFHDNIYCLGKGMKKFTVFSPIDAKYMSLNGKVATIHPNGLIVYEGLSHIRSDGAYLADVCRWKIDKIEDEINQMDGPTDDLEVEVDNLLGELLEYEEEQEEELEDRNAEVPSFSSITPIELRQDYSKHPLLCHTTPMQFELQAGETLYLPCGWFHEVRSRSTSGMHMALNYWLAPPTDGNYCDDYWKESFWDPLQDELKQARDVS